MAPDDIGWSIRRSRRLTCLTLRDKWVCEATPQEFAEFFHASCRTLGCDLFAYGALDDARVQADYRDELAKTLDVDVDPEHVTCRLMSACSV